MKHLWLISTRFAMCTSLLLALAGCAVGTVSYSDNPITSMITPPRIETVNKRAYVEITERVSGVGCRSSFMGVLKSSEGQLLTHGGSRLTNDHDYAKAAAHFDALHGKAKRRNSELGHATLSNNDMLISPAYQIEEKHSLWGKETCVTVHGFRGVIKLFEDTETTTAWPDLREVKVLRRKTPDGESIEMLMIYDPVNAKPETITPLTLEQGDWSRLQLGRGQGHPTWNGSPIKIINNPSQAQVLPHGLAEKPD